MGLRPPLRHRADLDLGLDWLPGQDWLRLAVADKGLFLEEEWLGMAFG